MKKLFVFAAALAVIVLSGCTGENGSLNTNTGTDENAKTVSENQNTAIVKVEEEADLEGMIRPPEAPADLPSSDNAYEFNYYDGGSILSFGYKVKSDDLVVVCDDIESKLKAAGWERTTEGMNDESPGNIYRQFTNDNYKLTESCSLTDGIPKIALIRSVKN